MWGVRHKSLNTHMQHLLQKYQPKMVALLEMKVENTSTNYTFTLLSHSLPMHVVVLGTGHGGGMWICWDPQTISAELVHNSAQHVTISHTFTNSPTSRGLLIVIYASPNWLQRRHPWESLSQFQLDHSTYHAHSPWLLMGDFNCILDQHEKRGGSTFL